MRLRPLHAAGVAYGAVVAAQLAGAAPGPSPNRPRTTLWYARLDKPGFTPPGPVFGIAWTLLDGLLGHAGARLLSTRPSASRNGALVCWSLTVGLVAGFPLALFGAKRLGSATAVSAAMLASATATTVLSLRVDRQAGLACMPLVAWTGFALLLQEELWRRN